MADGQSTSPNPSSVMAVIFAISLLLWLALAGSLDSQEVVTGLIVSVIVSLLFYRRMTILSGLRLDWLMPLHLLIYLLEFIVALIWANLDLARRVLMPSLPIQPALVEIETSLNSDLGRLLLANTITLTPGTLSVDMQGNRLTVHWVYCPAGLSPQEITERIAGRFERRISRFIR